MVNYEMRLVPNLDCEGKVYWTVLFPAIEGCVGGGYTPEEAVKEALENLNLYLEYLQEENLPLPTPYVTKLNGNITIRSRAKS